MTKREIKPNLRRILVPILFFVVVVVTALLVFAREDLYGMLRALRDANYGFVFLAMGAYLFSIMLWAARLRVALSVTGNFPSLRNLYLVICGGIFINNVTPFTYTGGDPIGRAYLLKKTQKIPYSSGFAAIISEFILDVPVFFSFLMLGVLMWLRAPSLWQTLAIVGIWIVAATLFIWGFSRFSRKRTAASKIKGILIRVLKLLRRRVNRKKITRDIERFYASAQIIVGRRKVALYMVAFSVVIWVLSILRLVLIFQALGYDASPVMLLLAATLPWMAGLIPLLPGGLGTVDTAIVSIFLLFEVPLGLAISAAFIERAISFIFSTALGACVLSYLGVRVWAR